MKRVRTSLVFALITGLIFVTVVLSFTVSRFPQPAHVVSQPPEPLPETPPRYPTPTTPRLTQNPPALRLPVPMPVPPEITPPPPPRPPVKSPDARTSETIMFPTEPGDRVAAARRRSEATIRALFAQAGIKYPAQQLFLRGLKREGELELWAADRSGPFKLVATYSVAALSGRPGPKRQEGDGQVPEGFYEVDRFNPLSNFHLSLGLNYPNPADRLLGHLERPGYDIFIHGNALSIGCLAMGDDRIEEIYLAAADAVGRPIPVHLFPARMNASDWHTWRDEQTFERPELAAFWNELRPAWDFFESRKSIPKITIQKDGRYRLEGRPR